MPKRVALAAAAFLAALVLGCPAPKPTRMCEYCRAPRLQEDVRLYPCRKCQKAHWSCSQERPLHAVEYSKAQKGSDSGGALGFAIKSCPP